MRSIIPLALLLSTTLSAQVQSTSRTTPFVFGDVITFQSEALDQERVLALLEGRVARYKYPKKTLFVDELPKTALGKVRKSDVQSLLAQLLRDTPTHPPEHMP